MLKLTSVILLSLFVLSSCTNSSHPPVQLTLDDMYDIDSVRASMATHSPMSKDQQKRLTKAVALYKVNQSYVHAIDSLRALILETPSAQAYFELGTVYLLDQDNYQAINALSIAEKLHAAPLYNTLYELSAAWSKVAMQQTTAKAEDTALYYMQIALQMGYPHPEKFRQDDAFKGLYHREAALFDNAFDLAMSGRKNISATLFQDFLVGFPTLNAPILMDTNWIRQQKFDEDSSIQLAFEKYVTEMHGTKFSREGDPNFFYIGKLKTDSSYIALVYAGTDNWEVALDAGDPDNRPTGPQSNIGAPLYFFLTTYSPQGKIIDKIMIAGQELNDQPMKQFSLTAGLEFTITDLTNHYRYSLQDSGYENNPIDSVISTTHFYRITPSGKFEQTPPHPLAYEPSASVAHPGTVSTTRQ